MRHSLRAPATLQCIDAASEDREFLDYARRLTRDNMQADYSRHGLIWDDAHFDRHWSETENYLMRAGDSKLGVLRLYLEPPACYSPLSAFARLGWVSNSQVTTISAATAGSH